LEQGVKIIITGGMGRRALDLFTRYTIQEVVGVPADTPERVIADYINGTLLSGENVCDH
jgi:predicted Fe-Mo cluster-binding NifX family protein